MAAAVIGVVCASPLIVALLTRMILLWCVRIRISRVGVGVCGRRIVGGTLLILVIAARFGLVAASLVVRRGGGGGVYVVGVR